MEGQQNINRIVACPAGCRWMGTVDWLESVQGKRRAQELQK